MPVKDNAKALMAKAGQGAISARPDLDAGDMNGTCNRAYYAMFDAARAALLAAQAPVPADISNTHPGLITGFGLHLLKYGLLPFEPGRQFSWAGEIRLVGDYPGDAVAQEVAAEMVVHQAERFVDAVRVRFPSWHGSWFCEMNFSNRRGAVPLHDHGQTGRSAHLGAHGGHRVVRHELSDTHVRLACAWHPRLLSLPLVFADVRRLSASQGTPLRRQ